MRLKKITMEKFKRFDNLTVDLGDEPKKIVAIIGPNGCGKSSIFDAFEKKMAEIRGSLFGGDSSSFYSKSMFYREKERRKSIDYNINITTDTNEEINKRTFYIRTSYRFTPKFNITTLSEAPDVDSYEECPYGSIDIDKRLESNYKRLIWETFKSFERGTTTGDEVRNQTIDKINEILSNVLDIKICSLGNITDKKGYFHFEKDNAADFPYENLSAGEKEVVDIIVDLFVKVKLFDNSIFCIDEPELHLNSSIQRKLLREIEKLIPENCQLWIATHSLGFMRALREDLHEKSQVLDFSERNYSTGTHTIKPIKLNRVNWQRIFETAIEDLSGLICPKKIVYCEGKDVPGKGGSERGFDAKVLNNIFSEKYNDVLFVSSGGNTELDQRSDIAISILSKVFSHLNIIVLKDRDMSSGRLNTEEDRQEYLRVNPKNHRILKRWEIENYLFDKEILKKYCDANKRDFDEENYDTFVKNIEDQNVKDSYTYFRNFCNINFSIGAEDFKLNLSQFITPDTYVFRELERCIFY